MADKLFTEVAYGSMNKAGEELCGDSMSVTRAGDSTIVILSDGLGSGVKAHILASLTVTMASTMLKEGGSIDMVLEALAATLPVCQLRELAYSTFTIAQIHDDGRVYLAEYDNPPAMVGKGRQAKAIERSERQIGERAVSEAFFQAQDGDWLVLVSDGVLHAGIGGVWNLGWGWERVEAYVRKVVAKDYSAAEVKDDLLTLVKRLYGGKPGDDVSCVVIKIRPPRLLTVMVGPPSCPDDDDLVVNRLLSLDGEKVVCGGTTAQVVARHLDVPLKVELTTMTSDVPPVARLEGVGLCTEGMLTLMKAKRLLVDATPHALRAKRDGASQLARALLMADQIHFLVGRAINPAHQSPDVPPELALKGQMVEDMIDLLEKRNVQVTADYF